MILFFDTETTGLPIDEDAPITDLDNWPRLVQLAYLIYDYNGKLLHSGNHIIRPVGFSIPTESTKIHGISTEKAIEEGLELGFVLREFNRLIEISDYIVAHNLIFDENIIGAEFLRSYMQNPLDIKDGFCTMIDAMELFNDSDNENSYYTKFPTLSELHYSLFRSDFDGAHNALNDVRATARCFWELISLGFIKLDISSRENSIPIDIKSIKNKLFEFDKANRQSPVHFQKSNSDNNNQDLVAVFFGKSEKYYGKILKYCAQNGIENVPQLVKMKALNLLINKLNIIAYDKSVDDEFDQLIKPHVFEAPRRIEKTRQEYRQEFIMKIEKEILEQEKQQKQSKLNESKNFNELEPPSKIENSDYEGKKYIRLKYFLYYYYLYRFVEFLPYEYKPSICNNDHYDSNRISRYPKSNDYYNIIYSDLHNDLREIIADEIPIYLSKLLNRNKLRLHMLYNEVGLTHMLYYNISQPFIYFITTQLLNWVKINTRSLQKSLNTNDIKMSARRFCALLLSELDKIPMCIDTRNWFDEQEELFKPYKIYI